LVERYREVTHSDIIMSIYDMNMLVFDKKITNYVLDDLTGFGNSRNCKLCIAVNVNCDSCIHNHFNNSDYDYIDDNYCLFHHTYDDIRDAKTPKKLLKAYEARANYIETIINDYEELLKTYKDKANYI